METKLQESLALLALSHTPVEHRLYETLLATSAEVNPHVGAFSLRRLLALTGLNSYSTLRRARAGLVEKMSIDCKRVADDTDGEEQLGCVYVVYGPEEIFQRRRQAGLEPYPRE